MQIEPCIRRAVDFEAVADVIVVGLGGAGAAAALAARAQGAEVLVLERASGGGGSTALAGGYVYLGGGTRIQAANHIDDSVAAMHDYLVATTPQPDHAKIRAYCEGSVEHFGWLEAQGVPFNDELYAEKHFEHPTMASLAWTGNEKLWPYDRIAPPAPRGHRAAAPAGTGGRAIMDRLMAQIAAAGVAVRCDSAACALVVDGEERVVGVRVRRFGAVSHV